MAPVACDGGKKTWRGRGGGNLVKVAPTQKRLIISATTDWLCDELLGLGDEPRGGGGGGGDKGNRGWE